MNKLPNLIIIGGQKSATTFFSNWLSAHPDIYMKSREDITFEDPEYENFSIDKLKINLTEKIYGIRR